MNTISVSHPGLSRSNAARGTLAPALALVALAPMIAEVLSGATRLSYIFVLIPEMMVWGCGALLIREVVRRWNAGGTSLLLLGLALSVAEEFIIQQTSLAPLPWLGSTPVYSRQWGVNWLFFLFMLGYESVWVVVVPVQLTELIFPERRNDLWLRDSWAGDLEPRFPVRLLHRMVCMDATGAADDFPRAAVSPVSRADWERRANDRCIGDRGLCVSGSGSQVE